MVKCLGNRHLRIQRRRAPMASLRPIRSTLPSSWTICPEQQDRADLEPAAISLASRTDTGDLPAR